MIDNNTCPICQRRLGSHPATLAKFDKRGQAQQRIGFCEYCLAQIDLFELIKAMQCQ